MASLHMNRAVSDTATQCFSLIERLLSLTGAKLSDKKQINVYLNDLNELDYRCLDIVNNDVRNIDVLWDILDQLYLGLFYGDLL